LSPLESAHVVGATVEDAAARVGAGTDELVADVAAGLPEQAARITAVRAAEGPRMIERAREALIDIGGPSICEVEGAHHDGSQPGPGQTATDLAGVRFVPTAIDHYEP
jgi:hypothetical protein